MGEFGLNLIMTPAGNVRFILTLLLALGFLFWQGWYKMSGIR